MTDEQIKDWKNCVEVAKVRSPNAWVAVDAGTVLAVESALRAAVPDGLKWPTMPKSQGQSNVLFDDGYEEGWSRCLEECRQMLEASHQAPQAAQPVQPKAFYTYIDITLTEEESALLRDTLGEGDQTSPVRLQIGNGHGGYGLYASSAEYPEEGAVRICDVAQPVQQSEQVRKPLSDAEIAEMILQEQFLLVVDDEESFAPSSVPTTFGRTDMLTDEQIAKIASTPCTVVGSYVHTFARAIEAAATAPLLERIADLERKSDQDEATMLWQAGEISKHLDRIAELERQLEQAREALSLALSDVEWRANSPTQKVIFKAHAAIQSKEKP